MDHWSLIDLLIYVAQGLVWSAGGFVVGRFFVRGKQKVDRVVEDLERIKEIVETDDAIEEVPEESETAREAEDREHREVRDADERVIDRWKQLFGIVLIVLAVFTVGQAWYFSDKNRQITECQSRQASAFQEAQVSRAQVAEQDRIVLDTMIITISRATTAEETRDALAKYIAARAKNDAERAKSPLPAIDTCGVKE